MKKSIPLPEDHGLRPWMNGGSAPRNPGGLPGLKSPKSPPIRVRRFLGRRRPTRSVKVLDDCVHARGAPVYKGKFLKIYSDDMILPNKNRMQVEYVKHPGAVCAVPFLSEDKIILIRQFRPVIRRYIWELPAGTLNKNEAIKNSAQRELIEEIGYRAKTLKEVGWVYTTPGFTTEKIHIFIARNLIKEKTEHEKDEVITSRVFTRAGVRRLFKKNLIVDAKTICALKLCEII